MGLNFYHKKTPIARGKGTYVLPPPENWITTKIAKNLVKQTLLLINTISKTTATEELAMLVDKEILRKTGTKGRGVSYTLND